MGALTQYVEAFIEEPRAGYRWRIYNNGEGMICFDYQEFQAGNWVNRPFSGVPADEAESVIAAINAVKHSPV